MRSRALAASLLVLSSCAPEVGSTGLAIHDPLDLIDDVQGPLRLFVLPADGYACVATTGAVSPEVPDVEQGMFDDAVADISLDVTSSAARGEVQVAGGMYTVLVRGKGTDPVTGIPNTFIATGCTNVMIGAGETVEIHITLIPIVGMGVCGDGVTSPDEQCEDGNTMAGDGCSATCRTEPFVISTAAGAQDHPSIGGAAGQRWVFTYNSGGTAVAIRLLEPNGATVTTPSVLTMDAPLSSALPSPLTGIYTLGNAAVSSSGRMGVSFVNFSGSMPALKVAFFDRNRTAEGNPATVRASTGMAGDASVAFAGDGSFMVVFEDATSGTGLSGQVFAPGAATPLMTDAFPVGASGASDPVVSGASDHFVVAFSAGGDVFVQRFGTDGAARDATPIAVLDDAAGTQDQPSVAALPDGRALVAWRDDGANGDGAGTAIRSRAFGADGASLGQPIVLDTTTAGDQSEPSVAGVGATYAVAFQSGAGVRARMISDRGDPLPNHQQPLTTADFEVAASGTQPAVSIGGTSSAPRFMVVWTEGGDIHGRLFPIP